MHDEHRDVRAILGFVPYLLGYVAVGVDLDRIAVILGERIIVEIVAILSSRVGIGGKRQEHLRVVPASGDTSDRPQSRQLDFVQLNAVKAVYLDL